MATVDYINRVFDGNDNGQAGTPNAPGNYQVSTTSDGTGPVETIMPGDTVFITDNGFVNVLQYTYEGSLTSPITGEKFILNDGSGTALLLSNDTIPDQMIYTFDDTVDLVVCFAAGTLIATPTGETTVETLSIGDMLLTQDGRTVPVKWVGRQTVSKVFTPVHDFEPVRVRAGALDDGLPHTDLVLTAGHALIIDDFAINAGALVNGTTITFEPSAFLPDRVTYYHIETENHDVILANGVPAETFVDHVGRRAFDNFAEYLDLYGDEHPIHEMDLPRISAARLVPPHIRARLAGRKVA